MSALIAEIMSVGAPLVPIEQVDAVGVQALSPIMYAAEYREALCYHRALVHAEEYSERGLRLSEYIITLNAAHYTVWGYRADCLRVLDRDPHEELLYLDGIARSSSKNYQIWHHREVMVRRLGRIPAGELEFLAEMLQEDAKNYHVWSYRQWLVKSFMHTRAERDAELEYAGELIQDDPYNNSAWNHRELVFYDGDGQPVDDGRLDEEIAFVKRQIERAPENKSSWSYLRALLRRHGRPLSTIQDFAQQMESVPALELMAETSYSGSTNEQKTAGAIYARLIEADPIRRKYWEFKAHRLGLEVSAR